MKFAETPKITVAIRKRPLNKKQIQKNELDIVRVSNNGQVTVCQHKQKVDLTKYLEQTTFNFDYAFDENSTNQQIYDHSIRPLIHNAFMGAKISCFAYGQTGSGKTHTMKGDMNKNIPGLYYLGAKEIFRYLQQTQFSHLHVTVSFYEIYCGRLYDLLNSRAELKIREDKKQNINVIGMQEKIICSANEFLDIIEYGSNFRVTSQNATNADSSRSHAILQISLKHQKKIFTKISFIDLAGNQRGADHIDQNKQTKIDGAEINKSLLSLKECIRALDQGKGHTPFRGSKLTMVLKDSFVGFCNTVMICNVSPNSTSSENTMNTLRYADRVKQLRQSSQGDNLSKQQLFSRQLMLPRANNKNCIKVNIDNNDDQQDILIKLEEARNQGQQISKHNPYEEKMDIEEPYENKKAFLGNAGRKTENLTSQIKLYNMAQKRGQITKQIRVNKIENNLNPIKSKSQLEVNKQPSFSKNAKQLQVDQNNLNFVNNSIPQYDLAKRQFMKPSQSRNVEVNPCFQAMGELKRDFNCYRQDQQNLIKQQMRILKQEMALKDQHKKAYCKNSYEQEIEDANLYLDSVQNCVMEKMNLFAQMQANLQKMRSAVKNVALFTKSRKDIHKNSQFRGNNCFNNNSSNSNRKMSKGKTRNIHGSLNNLQFNHFKQPEYDEQLLQGLPGDQSMLRLF